MCKIKKILCLILVAAIVSPCNYASAEQSDKAGITDEKTSKTEELKISSNVINLTGYVPVKAVGAKATQKTADELLDTLSKGNIGEELTFDEKVYPYFYMLNDTEKSLYKQIFANAEDMNKRFLPVEIATEDEIKNAFTAVVNDHPELFWMDMAYKYRYSPSGQVVEINLVFNITANNITEYKSKFDAAAKKLVNNTYGLYTDYKKEKKVHNDLLSSVKYDSNAPINQSAYSALVYGRTVSAGYSRAFQYIMQQLNIPCYFVMGDAGSSHAWNIVKLDNGYYNVDTTWNDTNPATYDYFNCSDDTFADNHERIGLSVYLPECDASKYSDLEKTPPVIEDKKPVVAEPEKKPETVIKPETVVPSQTIVENNTQNNNYNNIANNIYSITVQTVRGQGDKGYIDNIEDYYIECFEKLMATDKSKVNFNVIVCSKDLWYEIYAEYADGRCQDGYIERFLVEKHKNSCTVNVQAQQRSDGSYIIRHSATIN